MAFIDNHLLPSIMILVRLRWHRLYRLRNQDWKPVLALPVMDTDLAMGEGRVDLALQTSVLGVKTLHNMGNTVHIYSSDTDVLVLALRIKSSRSQAEQ